MHFFLITNVELNLKFCYFSKCKHTVIVINNKPVKCFSTFYWSCTFISSHNFSGTGIITSCLNVPQSMRHVAWWPLLWSIFRYPLILVKSLPVTLRSGSWFNIKIPSYQYRKSHCGEKTILRPSYLHNGISYTGKITLRWHLYIESGPRYLEISWFILKWVSNKV